MSCSAKEASARLLSLVALTSLHNSARVTNIIADFFVFLCKLPLWKTGWRRRNVRESDNVYVIVCGSSIYYCNGCLSCFAHSIVVPHRSRLVYDNNNLDENKDSANQ